MLLGKPDSLLPLRGACLRGSVLFNITRLSVGKDAGIVAIKSILKDILPKAPENIILP
jgi:hypothetical protein